MKTALSKISNERAKKELQQFAIIGLACSAVSLVFLWFLSIVGLAFSLRALLLAGHKGNTGQPKTSVYRGIAATGILLGLLSLVLYLAAR